MTKIQWLQWQIWWDREYHSYIVLAVFVAFAALNDHMLTTCWGYMDYKCCSQGSTNCSILQYRMGIHGVIWENMEKMENMESMEKMENIK